MIDLLLFFMFMLPAAIAIWGLIIVGLIYIWRFLNDD